MIDLNELNEQLKVPEFEEPKTFEELIEQMAIISEEIGRCEKILQHLAIAGYAADIDEYIEKHIKLISIKNRIYTKMKEMAKKDPKYQQQVF